MPRSHWALLSYVIDTLIQLQPRTILDAGCGSGNYGCLIRMHLEPESWPPDLAQPPRKGNWQRTIDAVDIYMPNMTPFHTLIYDNVHVADIRQYVTVMRTYDVILLADVIEHLEKREGLDLLRNLLGKARQAVLVTTPVGFLPQGPVGGNEAEAHRSAWWPSDFRAFPRAFVDLEKHTMLVVLCTEAEAAKSVRQVRMRRSIYRIAYAALGPRLGTRAVALLRAVRRWLLEKGLATRG